MLNKKEDIIRMAREVGVVLSTAPMSEVWRFIDDEGLERFYQDAYAAGQAYEREECAKVCENADKSTHPADLADDIRARRDGVTYGEATLRGLQ